MLKIQNSKDLDWTIERNYKLIIHNKNGDIHVYSDTLFKWKDDDLLFVDVGKNKFKWIEIDYDISKHLFKFLKYDFEKYNTFKIDFNNISL